MLVITKFRPMAPLAQIEALLDRISKVQSRVSASRQDDISSNIYFNEASAELVIVTRLENFAAIDRLEVDEENNRIGAEILRAGFIPHSVEYWRDLPGHFARIKDYL